MSRIISGRFRGRKLIAPGKLDLRPTTDRAKEALFNILRSRVDFEQIRVLDLFAGIGNISLEMASRGAEDVTAVEINPKAAAFIEGKAEELGLDDFRILKTDALRFLQSGYEKWGLIFADPPYAYSEHRQLVDTVFQRGLLEKHGLLIVEHGEEVELSDHAFYRESRKYSRVIFSFFHEDAS